MMTVTVGVSVFSNSALFCTLDLRVCETDKYFNGCFGFKMSSAEKAKSLSTVTSILIIFYCYVLSYLIMNSVYVAVLLGMGSSGLASDPHIKFNMTSMTASLL